MFADIERLRDYTYGAGDRTRAVDAATDLLRWSETIETQFPPEQTSKDYLDMSSERVRQAARAMPQTARELLDAARTEDRPAIADKLAQVERNGCGSCHHGHISAAPH
jgi:hypothetical protein